MVAIVIDIRRMLSIVGLVNDIAPRRGRPAGYLMNPEVARWLLGKRSQSQWATAAEVSTAHLSAMINGSKAATADVAARLTATLASDLPVGALFPELAQFTTTIRHFTAPKVSEAA